jgi:hypothetical protein
LKIFFKVQLQLENLQKEKNELSMLHDVLTRTNETLKQDTNTLQEIVKMLQTLPQFQNDSAPEAVKTLIKNYKALLEEKAKLEIKTTGINYKKIDSFLISEFTLSICFFLVVVEFYWLKIF